MARFDVELAEDRARAAMAILRARAWASGGRRPLLCDPAAVEIVAASPDADLILDARLLRSVLCSRVLDRWVSAFLAERPVSTVVEIGSGLSTRFERVDNGRAHWVHIDPAEVVALREGLFTGSPRRTVVIGDVSDPSWLPATAGRPAPLLILIESGPLVLAEPDVRRLVTTVAAHFPAARIAAQLRNRVELGIELRALALRQVASRTLARELLCVPPSSWWASPVGAAARACLHSYPLSLLQCSGPGTAPVVTTQPIDRTRRHRSSPRPHPTPGLRAARHARSRALLAARRASTSRGPDLAATHQEDPPCPRSPRSTP